jgi:hypothetical protein
LALALPYLLYAHLHLYSYKLVYYFCPRRRRPNSWSAAASANTYDSLAETYAALSNKKLASQYYTRTLQLNPQNRTAAEYLK